MNTQRSGIGHSRRLLLATTVLAAALVVTLLAAGLPPWLDTAPRAGAAASTSSIALRVVHRVAAPRLATAAPFLLEEIRTKDRGDWAAAWHTLYPMHQRRAPLTEYVACERRTAWPTGLQFARVVSVHRAAVTVAGLRHPLPGVAITLRVGLRWFGPRDPITLTHTFHLVPVAGSWRWLLSPESYRIYGNNCQQPPTA
jgi:hypothetical protein